ncbi:MAG TPA: enolase C-terminal domain-like protein [Pseudonocardia sp.]|uniref:enolase C-terminal domain-like protein n=1 Tax=Pseudonocardia sp. TaxID=60912 RepID=UPI002B9FA10D|nr:enolase C-terminal domain-like protein [Pseudonocardia sp.]HTF53886.1 enolase C-terminal domain-like protein [Pseudonocardia sp.]
MKIAAVRCVEYTGTMDHPGAFWEERLIRPVDIYPQFSGDGPEFLPPSGSGSYRMTSRFVHIETDNGVAGSAGPITAEQAYLITTKLAPLLVSQDPLATEYLWDVLYRYCVHGRKGVEMHAISALDCALWDLKGRHLGVPVFVLLGGPVRDAIPAYASTLGYSLDLDRVRERATELVAQGFTATKWFPRHGPLDGKAGMAANVALIAALREAVGPDVDIMVDAWMSWDVPYTLRMADRLAEYAPRWIEEPVLPDKPHSYAEITRRIRGDIQVSGAEHEYTRWGIHQLMAAEAMHIYQPDTYWAGGISEMCKIAALASTYDVQLIPHGHSVPANTHFSFAQPATLTPLVEYLVKWNVVNQWFLKHPVHPVNGQLLPPTEPGLGTDLDPDKIERRRELTFP